MNAKSLFQIKHVTYFGRKSERKSKQQEQCIQYVLCVCV